MLCTLEPALAFFACSCTVKINHISTVSKLLYIFKVLIFNMSLPSCLFCIVFKIMVYKYVRNFICPEENKCMFNIIQFNCSCEYKLQ